MLTIEQVREEAKTPEKALELSIQHWLENYEITKELLARRDYYAIAAGLCGLCRFHSVGITCLSVNCENCPISPKCFYPESLYKAATKAYGAFFYDDSEENYQAWRTAAKAMHKYLVSLRSTSQQSS